MIFLTESPNDADLPPIIGDLGRVVPLPHGDFAFFGQWTGGSTIRVCGDRKKIGEVAAAALAQGDGSARYLQQYQDCREAGYQDVYLLVEGIWRRCPETGLLQVNRWGRWVYWRLNPKDAMSRTISYTQVDNYLNQLYRYLGVMVKRTANPEETADAIIGLYLLYSKPPESHTTLQQFYVPANPEPYDLMGRRPGLVRRIAKELPDIGWKLSARVAERFGTVQEMVRASEKEWAEIEGIGEGIAERVVRAIRGWEAGSGGGSRVGSGVGSGVGQRRANRNGRRG